MRGFMLKVLIFLGVIIMSCKSSSQQTQTEIVMTDTTFSFVLTDSFDETSKDSHDYSKTLSVKSGVLHYDYVYRGFPDDQAEHKEMPADESMIKAIRDKIKELRLDTNYVKRYPVNERGFIVRTGMHLTIQDSADKYSISVTGGRPMDINDRLNDKMSELYYFVNRYFDKK
jgi:hypothetical protein